MRKRGLFALGLLAGVPFLGALWLARATATSVVQSLAQPAHWVGERIADAATHDVPVPLEPTEEAAALLALGSKSRPIAPSDGEPVIALSGARREARVQEVARVEELPAPVGVLVKRQRVMAAARAGIRPSGSPVAMNAWRGRGLALAGVGMVGVGLRDGDVVTKVGGSPATSDAAVVGAVTAALRKGHPAITAEVWRDRQKIIVTVELPKVRFGEPDEPRGEPVEERNTTRPEASKRAPAGTTAGSTAGSTAVSTWPKSRPLRRSHP
ncbi:MAG: hypothetical protein EXR75_07830 [Myxococcales bacterium]|nr:hypothetical protein [Myxococcales bacterium]